MKKIIKLGIIIAVAGLLLSSGYIYDAIFGSANYGRSVSENVHFIEIDNAIIAMEKTKWSVQEYKDIQSKIATKKTSNLIDDDESYILQEGLDRTYIPKLVKATKTFFYGTCDDRRKLSLLHGELKRYHSGSVEKKYKKDVDEYKSATSNLYSLAGYDPIGGGQRGGYDGEIERYVIKSYDKSKTENYIKELERLSQTKYVKKCILGKDSYSRNIKRLDDHFYNSINNKIETYVKTRSFSKDMTEDYYAELSVYKLENIRKKSSEVNQRIGKAVGLLERHYYDDLKKQIEGYVKGGSHSKPETERYATIIDEYVKMKDHSLRIKNEVKSKSDDLFIFWMAFNGCEINN